MKSIPIGQTFNRLTVIADAGQDNRSKRRVKCLCACGKGTEADLYNIKSGAVQSCGCLVADLNRSRTTHGNTVGGMITREYSTWVHIKARCENPDAAHYKHYGGRGITVCERWQVFENFLADMGTKPEGLSIERINNDLGYSLDNCRWANHTEQCNNRRSSRFVTFNGLTLTVAQWAKKTGVRASNIGRRIGYGWPLERVLAP